jgi:hypothetical protein
MHGAFDSANEHAEHRLCTYYYCNSQDQIDPPGSRKLDRTIRPCGVGCAWQVGNGMHDTRIFILTRLYELCVLTPGHWDRI